MDGERKFRPIPAWRVCGLGIVVVFLLDIVGHTIDLYLRGIPATLANIHQYGTRAGHAEAWIVGGILVLGYGAFVAGQAVGAILKGRA